MSGLDKILAEIREEAAAEAKQAVAAARAEADKIVADAKAESEAVVGRITASANADVADIGRSRESALSLQRRQRTLAQKQALLAETLLVARQRVEALPEGEYFALLVKLAQNAAQPGEGVLLLCEEDKRRLPADFIKRLAEVLPAGSSLTVSDLSRDTGGGFVLKYGDVEENCSIEAIFNARADEFSDAIRPVLFG